MPVYLRSKLAFTPSSMGEFPPDETYDSDFLQDPAQHRDELPQPYRMIDKVLNRLIDNTWEIIEAREQKRIAEASKIRPPIYECSVTMSEHDDVNCMASSPDGTVVILGKRSGLAVIDAHSHETLGCHATAASIIHVHVSQLGEEAHIAATIDNQGNAEMFVVAGDRFYPLEKLNEPQEGGSKMLAQKCELSSDGEFVGVYMETPAGQDGVLQIHKLPRDTLSKELEQALSKDPVAKHTPSHHPDPSSVHSPVPQGEETSIDYSHPSEGQSAVGEQPQEEDQTSQGRRSRSRQRSGSRRREHAQRDKQQPSPSAINDGYLHVPLSPVGSRNRAKGHKDNMGWKHKQMIASRPTTDHNVAATLEPGRRHAMERGRKTQHATNTNITIAGQSDGRTPTDAGMLPVNRLETEARRAVRGPGLPPIIAVQSPAEVTPRRSRGQPSPRAVSYQGTVGEASPNLPLYGYQANSGTSMLPMTTKSRANKNYNQSETSPQMNLRVHVMNEDPASMIETPSNDGNEGQTPHMKKNEMSKILQKPTRQKSPKKEKNARSKTSPKKEKNAQSNISPTSSRNTLRKEKTEKTPPQSGSGKSSRSGMASSIKSSSQSSLASVKSNRSAERRREPAAGTKSRSPSAGGKKEKSGKLGKKEKDGRQQNDPTRLAVPRGRSRTSTPKAGSPHPPERVSIKFSPSTIVLKVKPPGQVQGVVWSSPLSLLKSIDHGDVFGTGANHQVSQQHLDQRYEDFKNVHKHHWPYMPQEDTANTHMCPTFHFLTAGRGIPQGLDGAPATGAAPYNSVLVWWRGHHQVSLYSLLKIAKVDPEEEPVVGKRGPKTPKKPTSSKKDLEPKADQVWPQASSIVASAVSPATSMVALALRNGHLLIWDKYLGVLRRLVEVSDQNDVAQLSFLDPRICPQEIASYPPYDTRTNCYVLVWRRSGKLMLVNCGLWVTDEPNDVSAELETEEDHYAQVLPMPGIPELALTCRNNGALYIHDILDGRVLCQVKVPEPYELLNPWEPTVTIGAMGQMLYIKGNCEEVVGDQPPQNSSAIFVFQLRYFPSLDAYRNLPRPTVPEVVHSTVENRVNALLTERMTQQVLRKSRMQERWGRMREELEAMKRARNMTKTPRSHVVFSVSTIERSAVNSPNKTIY